MTVEPKNPKRPVTARELYTIFDAIVGTLQTNVDAIKQLRERVGELEKTPPMVATGYRDGERYLTGAHVVRNGALYRCTRSTREAPGQSDHWEAISAGVVYYHSTTSTR